jgi:DNA polymerase III subunit delta'
VTEARGFIGQDAAWREWQQALASERMHHAWLLTGAPGLGKHQFARAAAAELVRLPGAARPDPTVHPDILILSPLPANDDEAKKKAEGKPHQTKRNISVDQIREMIRRLSTKATLSDRRAIIVDPADALEKSAVNALLKALEEPPAGTFFLLVSHQAGQLLPTVRSRCRMLRFAALSPEEIDAVILREFPEASPQQRAAAIAAAGGSPGIGLAIIEHDLAGIHALMQRIMIEGDPSFALRGALAAEMGARPLRERQLAVLDLARQALTMRLADAPNAQQLRIIAAYEDLVTLTRQAPTYNFDAGLLILEIGGLLASTAMPRETAR